MSTAQINITLGTAGHIDHGKTALIKCLTGCDTDHLKAEKERGMSIELGFAPCTISDIEVGIVDVPGHENFIKTMVAGASGIDGVIFVIAADDGVMPQTREHLDILTLLGVRHGIVALTKVDCVQPDRISAATAEIEDFLRSTFLENAPILPLSSITGQGFDGFYEALKSLVGAIEPKTVDGVFRLPVERAFSLKGYGTVVTGIPVSGQARIGDEVVLFPYGTKGRIKAVQVYKRESDTALSGQCAALNVPQWDHKLISRGNVVTQPGYFSPQQWCLCRLHLLGSARAGLKNGAAVKFHTGTSEVVAAVYLMEGSSVTAGQECLIQVRLSEPVVAGPGDRFIVRSLSPAQTLGGGIIVEAIPARLHRSRQAVVQDAQARANAVLARKDFVEYCIKTAAGLAASEAEISFRAKLPPASLRQILGELVREGKVLNLTSKLYIHTDTAVAAEQRLLDIVDRFHSSSPESPGMTAEQLFGASGLEKEVFDGLVKLLISQGRLAERKHRLALPTHRESLDDEETRLLETIESLFQKRLFDPPGCEEVGRHCSAGKDKVERILRILIEYEKLMRVENDLLFHRQAVERAREILVSYLTKEGKLESVKFKYLLDTTRKYAIPLLDYMDRIGVTRRLGNTRYLKAPGNSG
ncbi:MAG TPA: selenocysteine-specific translation elongation factor [Sedimentisphaerales bacterium]|nr:selenocysteine-specific translation elongation factor [Sedimentisphaerales bacterium]